MKYDVLVNFTDGADKHAPDGKNVYYAGEGFYPRDGYTPNPERIKALQGKDNALKKPLIGLVDKDPTAPVEAKQDAKK
ncbi:hypothetical protein LJC74_03110 [Eubacteriales bacterium OttesenSCG-928-A19]|nr:hypothetical protein [Eubacteriales bacterium OttesenSCG-928-A19]